MRILSALLLLSALLSGCHQEAPRPAAPHAIPKNFKHVETEDSCVDAWLTQHGFDSFGNAADTNYPSGTPLFDERTGKSINRFDYVYARHPEAKQACAQLRAAPTTR